VNLTKSSLLLDFEKCCFVHIDRLIATIMLPIWFIMKFSMTFSGQRAREKRLKEWKRQWKIDLIQKMNPDWQDLYHNII
jgi:hypothetical protein